MCVCVCETPTGLVNARGGLVQPLLTAWGTLDSQSAESGMLSSEFVEGRIMDLSIVNDE